MSAIKRYQTVYEFQKAHLKTRNRYSGRKDEANDVLFFHSRNFLDQQVNKRQHHLEEVQLKSLTKAFRLHTKFYLTLI